MIQDKFNSFVGKYQAIDFEQIKIEDYFPAFQKGIQLGLEDVDRITSNLQEASFENTILALEESGIYLNQVCEVFFNLNSADTNPEMQKLAQEVSPLLSKYQNDIALNEALFLRIKAVYDQMDSLGLDTESAMLLDKTYKGFSRNGALLNETQKDELRAIDEKLSLTSLKFGENVLEENNSYELHITDAKDLEGLPESSIESAEMTAKEKGKEGWVITLDYPSYVPFVTYSKNRALREELTKASGSKAFKANEFNNEQNILDIVRLKHQRANLLGYKSHADYVLEQRMAEKAQTVLDFLQNILEASMPFAQKELNELKEIAKQDGVEDFQRWDSAYYAEKLKMAKYDFDTELLRPYFKLEYVIDGVFQVAQKLFGLRFELDASIPKYHQDVLTYTVFDKDNNVKALFYADYFPRASKRQGAWMTSFRGQYKRKGKEQHPIVSIVCNFTKSTASKPSLLTFDEVTTLFHEFGDALHGLVADGKYESLSGTNVYWDFVELPSQILENWCFEKECLDLFAKHYQTNESIPQELIDKIKTSSNFNAGMQTVRQVGLGMLDMNWHSEKGITATSVKAFEEASNAPTELMASIPTSSTSCSFSHIFQGGYSAGYYSYKWAEVLDADAFEFFKEKGIFNQEVAQSFCKNILSAGGSEHPKVLYKRFRGQEPDVNALLRRAGLKK